MLVELIDHTKDPETTIAIASANCYNARTDPISNHKRILKFASSDWAHESVLRFAYASFNVSGISRVCSHQLVRTSHAGFLQISQRYTNAGDMGCTIPSSFDKVDPSMYSETIQNYKETYKNLVDNGVPLEDARYILPEGTHTIVNMTGNFQMWRKFLKARLSIRAQWEIRELATEIHNKLYGLAPNVFNLTVV
jgi:thymidylate synthase (FAD)